MQRFGMGDRRKGGWRSGFRFEENYVEVVEAVKVVENYVEVEENRPYTRLSRALCLGYPGRDSEKNFQLQAMGRLPHRDRALVSVRSVRVGRTDRCGMPENPGDGPFPS